LEIDIIWDKLKRVFSDIFENDQIIIGPETTADDIEEWDSLSHIQLLIALEEAFGIRFNTGEVAKLGNVGEMVNMIAGKAGANGKTF
jgi:acyl carrier protein